MTGCLGVSDEFSFLRNDNTDGGNDYKQRQKNEVFWQ